MTRSRRRLRLAGAAVASVAMLVLLVAGLSKLADVPEFIRSLGTWTLIPGWGRVVIGFSVPLVELGLGLGWFVLAPQRRRLAVAAILMLLVFSGMYGAHLALGVRPDCGCLGKILAFKEDMNTAQIVLLRNALLAGSLGWYLVCVRRVEGVESPAGTTRVGRDESPSGNDRNKGGGVGRDACSMGLRG